VWQIQGLKNLGQKLSGKEVSKCQTELIAGETIDKLHRGLDVKRSILYQVRPSTKNA
jgi:hypothetical protein